MVEQLPDLLEKVNAGEREFIPDSDKCAELLRCSYPVASSLLISFEDDSLDESDAVCSCRGPSSALTCFQNYT